MFPSFFRGLSGRASTTNHSLRRSDDWTILVAAIGYVGFCIIAFILANEEAANPVFSVETGEGVITTLLCGEVVFQATCLVFKLSLTIFFRKFLVVEWQRWLVLGCGFFYCSTCVVGIFLALFQCGLPTHLMHKHLTGQCVPLQAFTALLYVHGILSAATDWVFAVLPIFTLYRSNLSRAAKISSSCLLLLACGGSVAAIARTATTGSYLLRPAYFDPNRRPNYYAVSAPMINLTVIEVGLGITAVSLACLRPLLRRAKVVGQHFTSRLMGSDMSKTEITDEEATVNLVVVDTKQMNGPVPTGSCWNRTPALGAATSAPPDLEASWNRTPALGGTANPLEASWNQTPALEDITSGPPLGASWSKTPPLDNITSPPSSLGASWSKTPSLGGGATILPPLGSSFNKTPAVGAIEPSPSLGASFNRTPAIKGSIDEESAKSNWKRMPRRKR
ncbi:hypothetical protein QM012_009250 [Aureobasidium pullulans]|uniref:Rhodopsin domain-containing protein n=1 Tax=Aureobasidium pullulans TaxID=5580 RepID=A0ABR0TGC7_AURPU